MKYKALGTSFILDKFATQLDFMHPAPKDKRFSRYVSDDYDKSASYGLMTGDYRGCI